MSYDGELITMGGDGKLVVPDNPVIPFIKGDEIGVDIWSATQPVLDAAVERAYSGSKQLKWHQVWAGEAANKQFGTFLPDATIDTFQECLVGIKGPLTTPTGGGMRSLNVELRQRLDLAVCARPVRWYKGVPSPVRRPWNTDMLVWRENSEDIYCGLEVEAGTPEAAKALAAMQEIFGDRFSKVRFGTKEQGVDFLNGLNEADRALLLGALEIKSVDDFKVEVGVGFKPVSRLGTLRHALTCIRQAILEGRESVTIVAKGNIMKYTEGAFRNWIYAGVKKMFGDKVWTWAEYDEIKASRGEEAANTAQTAALDGGAIEIKYSIADAFLQQALTRPKEHQLLITLNLNGDYVSDLAAATVGGIGIAPGGNINHFSGHAIFEATHGTAPKYTNLDKVNPGSVILSGEMMLRYLGWTEAADLVVQGLEAAIATRHVTYDFARLLREDEEEEGVAAADSTVVEIACSAFGQGIIAGM